MNRPEMLNRRKESGRGILAVLCAVLCALCLFLCADIAIANTYYVVEIVGTSMEDTLRDGDFVYAEREFTAGRGDVVIIDVSENEVFEEKAHRKGDKIVKRIVAMGGDSVKCEHGVVYLKIDGGEYTALNEDYTKGMNVFDNFPEVTLGDGEIFVLGDNRSVSLDSRAIGALSYGDIVGRVPAWAIRSHTHITRWEQFRSALVGWMR